MRRAYSTINLSHCDCGRRNKKQIGSQYSGSSAHANSF